MVLHLFFCFQYDIQIPLTIFIKAFHVLSLRTWLKYVLHARF